MSQEKTPDSSRVFEKSVSKGASCNDASPGRLPSLAALGRAEEEANVIEGALQQGAEEALADHLGAGRAVYYRDEEHDEHLVEEHPDGRRFYVKLDGDFDVHILREIPTRET